MKQTVEAVECSADEFAGAPAYRFKKECYNSRVPPMRYFVTVKTRAREDRIEAIDPVHFSVSVRALPIEGRANEAVRRLLAQAIGVASSSLRLVAGEAGKKKVFDYAEK